MASMQLKEKQHHHHTLVHWIVFLGIFLTIAVTFQMVIVPTATLGFVKSLFSPEKVGGLVEFADAVWASPTSEGRANAGKTIKKSYTNREYIFDFSSAHRVEAESGYRKESNEWVVKNPKLGEEAIILESYGFYVLSFDVGFVLAILITFFLPPSIGYMSQKVEREIAHTKDKVRLQTGFGDDVVELLTLPDSRLASQDRDYLKKIFHRIWDRTKPEGDDAKNSINFKEVFDDETDVVNFRTEGLDVRIKEHFSDFVEKEIVDNRAAREWSTNRLRVFKALRLYMSHHFTESYSNNVTGLAYGGAALLIIAVGIRGLKFIPATRPSLILLAIFLEFSMLSLLAFSLFYTEEEERMDKMLKKMEDANKSQLDTMKVVAVDMHKLADALVGETSELIKKKVEEAIRATLASDDKVRQIVADEVSEKIIIGLRETLKHRP